MNLPQSCKDGHCQGRCARLDYVLGTVRALHEARRGGDAGVAKETLERLATEPGTCFMALSLDTYHRLAADATAEAPRHPAVGLPALDNIRLVQAWFAESLPPLANDLWLGGLVQRIIFQTPGLRRTHVNYLTSLIGLVGPVEPVLAYPQCLNPSDADIALVVLAVLTGLSGKEVLAARDDQDLRRAVATLAVLRDPALAPWARHVRTTWGGQ
ncbi:hypothetical protein [Modestobacter sp. SYSU DS0875]